MNIEALHSAIDVLNQAAENFSKMPEQNQESLMASMNLQMSSLYLVDLLQNLQNGSDPYEAYLAVAQGDTPLDEFSRVLDTLMPSADDSVSPCPCCGTLVPAGTINRDVLKDVSAE